MLVDFYFAQKTFFPKNLLPNSGCGLSTDAAYTRVNTVYVYIYKLQTVLFWPSGPHQCSADAEMKVKL